jgi:2,5-dihydroxypyridine 5,6-dioxygenase
VRLPARWQNDEVNHTFQEGYLMALSLALLDGWKHLLNLCKVTGQEIVVVLIGDESHPDHVSAARMALAMIGAKTCIVQLGEAVLRRTDGHPVALGPTALAGNYAAVDAMKRADIVVDLFGMYRGAEQREIQAAGTRVILVKEPPETFLRLLPTKDDQRRVEAAQRRLQRAKTMHVTSAAGTDLRVALGEFPCLTQYGFTDEPGRWDHCPSAFVAIWPSELSSNGTVVLSPGDTILPFKSYVHTPVKLTICEGYIRDIEGGFDADYLRDYMASFQDPEGYAVAHLGWGLHSKARWTTLGLQDKQQTNGMDARSFYGSFMFSTGQNADIGGKRSTKCHLDIPMRRCSVHVDGEAMVIDGDIVAEDQKARV